MSRIRLPFFLLLFASGCGNREELKDLYHEQGRFKVRMPAAGHEPKGVPVQETSGKQGIKVSFHHVTAKHGYFVSYMDTSFPENEPEDEKFKRLKNSEAFAIKDRNATLLESKKSLSQERYPTVDYTATLPDKKAIRCREVFAKNRLYTIQAIGDASFVKSSSVNEFFDSFQIVIP